MRTAEHGDSAGYRSPSTGVGSKGPTELKCRPRKGIARENPALRPARDAVSVRLFRQHTQGSAIRGTGSQLRRGSCHRSGQPRNTRGGERGWGKDTAAPASACSYKEGEKREGGGVTLCPLRLLTALRRPFLHVGGEFYSADFCVTTSTVSSHNCAPFYLCVDSCVCHERTAEEKM